MSKQRYNIGAVALFLLLAVFYFVPRDCDVFASCDWFVAVPTLAAALFTAVKFRCGGVLIPLALLASAAGDMAGAMHNFILQVAFFACAHLFYIADFGSKWRRSIRRMFCVVLCAVVTLGFLGYVMAHIKVQTELYAVGVYGLIIFSMGATAIMQQRAHGVWYIVAAALFIFSDSVIAYNKFVEPVANSTLWIMTTYYAAQCIFMSLHLLRRSGR